MDAPLTKLPTHILRLADLTNKRPSSFDLEPDHDVRALIADALGIIGLKKLRFHGKIAPEGSTDWALSADLGATLVQACVVTLDPVTTRIDEKVTRRYLADMPEVVGAEFQMDGDDTTEALPATLDLYQVLIEALTLALPPYPRKSEVELTQSTYAAPGITPMTDDDARPFAGLAALKGALKTGGDGADE